MKNKRTLSSESAGSPAARSPAARTKPEAANTPTQDMDQVGASAVVPMPQREPPALVTDPGYAPELAEAFEALARAEPEYAASSAADAMEWLRRRK